MSKKLDKDALISATSTSCHGCVFAISEKDTQVGCMAGQVDKFKKAGVEVLEVFNEEDGEFYLIKDKLCAYYRPNEIKEVLDVTADQLLKNIQAKMTIKYQVILFWRQDDTMDDLRNRVEELYNQKIKPEIVTVIDRSHSKIPREGEAMKLFHNEYGFNYWRIQRASAVDQLDIELVDICYDNTKKHKFFFYMIFESSHPIPTSFSEEIHESIQDKMMAFVILQPNDKGIGGGALKAAHAKYAGNSFNVPLEGKIEHYGDSTHLIKKVEDLCPSLRTS